MRNRIWAALLVFFMAVGLLSGCSGSSDGNSSDGNSSRRDIKDQDAAEAGRGTVSGALPSGDVSLKVWCEEDQYETVQKMVDSFVQAHEGEADFNIVIEFQSDAGLRDVMLTDVHNGADVFSFPDDQLNSLVAGGVLSPVPNAEEIEKINVAEAVSAAKVGDVLYAYPMTADNGYFLYYDKKYFSEKDVATLDSILSIAEENGKKFSMEFNGGWYLYSFFGNTGMEMYLSDDGLSNVCDWNSVENRIKGVDVTRALLEITSHPGFASNPDGAWLELAEQGEVIAAVSGTWNAVGVKRIWGDNYGACKLPTYTCKGEQIQMSSFVGYKMMGVNYYSQQKEWAFKLAEWMTNEQNQTLRFVELNVGPSNIAAAASDEVKKVPAIAAVIDQSQYGRLQRVGNTYWDACTNYANTILEGNPSNISLQDLNDKLVKEITAK